jgi:WD repeat-containing protein mio
LNEKQKLLPSVVRSYGPEESSRANKGQNSRVPDSLEDPVLYQREHTTLHHPGLHECPILTDWEKLVSMDRGEGIIRWSPNLARNEFLTINVNYRIIKLFKAVGYAVPERFDFQLLSKHSDFQLITAFDWSPRIAGLVALGTKDGSVQLLRIDDDSNDCFTLPLKLQRACQAVAFNTTGLLAVGLDRVRNDQCLQIWDVNQRLSKWDPSKKGWQSPTTSSLDPVYKLEPSLAIASVKFFGDQPQTLVVGIKNQSVRIHDLRGLLSSYCWQAEC